MGAQNKYSALGKRKRFQSLEIEEEPPKKLAKNTVGREVCVVYIFSIS